MAGFRTFATGEVLTAANVNDFLMKQSVMVFADAAARTTALGAEVAEGMLTYNEDTEQLEVFDGAAFVLAAPAPPAGIGSNVVQTVKTDTFTTTSTTFTAVTGLSATITPSSATAKILVTVSLVYGHSNPANLILFNLMRGAGAIAQGTGGTNNATLGLLSQEGSNEGANSASITFLDSPATAAAVTYSIETRTSAGTLTVNRRALDTVASSVSTITAIEVAA